MTGLANQPNEPEPLRQRGRPKGIPKTGGRQKGAQNKATRQKHQALIDALIAERLTPEQALELQPLQVMLRIMRSRLQVGDDVGALAAAAAAAPYVHARLSNSDLRVTNTMAEKSDEQLAAELADLEARMIAARVVN
jgi:hypothetical protein